VLKFIAGRTAFNAGRTHPQNLDFCAENLMQTVQHLMSRTIPRFLCKQCSRTAFNEAVLFLDICALTSLKIVPSFFSNSTSCSANSTSLSALSSSPEK